MSCSHTVENVYFYFAPCDSHQISKVHWPPSPCPLNFLTYVTEQLRDYMSGLVTLYLLTLCSRFFLSLSSNDRPLNLRHQTFPGKVNLRGIQFLSSIFSLFFLSVVIVEQLSLNPTTTDFHSNGLWSEYQGDNRLNHCRITSFSWYL